MQYQSNVPSFPIRPSVHIEKTLADLHACLAYARRRISNQIDSNLTELMNYKIESGQVRLEPNFESIEGHVHNLIEFANEIHKLTKQYESNWKKELNECKQFNPLVSVVNSTGYSRSCQDCGCMDSEHKN